MRKEVIALGSAALVMAAAQAQAQTATATVNLEATVSEKCAIIAAEGQQTLTRDVSFGDITEETG